MTSWHCLPFVNPFRRKGSYMSLALLKNFENLLAQRIKMLFPERKEGVLHLSWMAYVVANIRVIHSDIETLVKDLEIPAFDWDWNLIHVYLDHSINLLNICIAFKSDLESVASDKPAIYNCFSALDDLAQNLEMPKIRTSVKGKIFVRAMYGVKMVTILVCGVVVAALSGVANKHMSLRSVETDTLWAEAFTDMRDYVDTEIRSLFFSGEMRAKRYEPVGTSFLNAKNIVTWEDILTKELNALCRVVRSVPIATLGPHREEWLVPE